MVAIISIEPANQTISEKTISFRWKYIMLPASVLILSVILAAYFYHLLPPEVAYHFKEGSPDRWMSRGSIIAWMVIPQFVLFLLAAIIISVAVAGGKRLRLLASTPVSKILSIMGNMVALPQVILTFAMLDVFVYNAYQTYLVPLWAIALIFIVLGGIILCVFFAQAIRQFHRAPGKSL